MIPKKECSKCHGTGIFKGYGKCYTCGGYGEMAHVGEDGTISVLKKQFKAGDTIPVRTSGKIEEGQISLFFIRTVPVIFGDGYYNLNDVWMVIINIRTGKTNPYPLHLSIGMIYAIEKNKNNNKNETQIPGKQD